MIKDQATDLGISGFTNLKDSYIAQDKSMQDKSSFDNGFMEHLTKELTK